MPFEKAEARLKEIGAVGVNRAFWDAVHANLTTMEDILHWWRVIEDRVTPVIEDAEFVHTAASLLPPEPWDGETWRAWTNDLKAKTGRKGKELFMPLRLALTGEAHGPEMKDLLPLIGREKALERLGG
jgi:glutamyl-tRNA synthetase